MDWTGSEETKYKISSFIHLVVEKLQRRRNKWRWNISVYNPELRGIPSGDIVYINQLNRKDGFSTNEQLVIQMNDQGEIYFFDLNHTDGELEYPIVVNPPGKQFSNNFLEFLEKKIKEWAVKSRK